MNKKHTARLAITALAAVLIVFSIQRGTTEKRIIKQFDNLQNTFQKIANQVLEEDERIVLTRENFEEVNVDLNTIFLETDIARIYRDYPVENAVTFEIAVSWINFYGIIYVPPTNGEMTKIGEFIVKPLGSPNWYVVSR